MTAPRQVIGGRTHLLTRRCTQRQFLLRPDGTVNHAFLYLLAEAAWRFNVTILAYVAMSNHMHLVVRDNDARLPEFLGHLNKMIAKLLNPYWGRTENFWSNEQASVVYLVQANDRFEKIIYTLANPVAAHLVERAEEWPGATSYTQLLTGETLTIERPTRFFRKKSPMPKSVQLKLGRPDGFEDLTHEEWAALVEKHVKDVEKKAHDEREADPEVKKRFVGREAVLAAPHTQTGLQIESPNELRPTVACLNRERRDLELDAIAGFQRAHREARKEWCKGNSSVLFPFGTYKMKTFGVLVVPENAAAPPSEAASEATMAPLTPTRGERKTTRLARGVGAPRGAVQSRKPDRAS